MPNTLDVVILGGGPVGILAASECAELGARTALISDGPLGGRAGWDSLVPSKTLIDAAHHWRGPGRPDEETWRALQERMARLSEAMHGPDEPRLSEAGVRLLMGKARFAGPNRLLYRTAGGRDAELGFGKVIITTGSVPNFSEGLRPDGERILAPRYLRQMAPPPESMLVVGGGVTGAEVAWAFAALGTKVQWIVSPGPLPMFDPEAVSEFLSHLTALGVEIAAGEPAVRVGQEGDGVELRTVDGRTYKAKAAFLALGRRADTESLHLVEAGLDQVGGALRVDAQCRTRVPNIFAAGDVTGAPFVLNKGLSQAWTAARVACGRPVPDFDTRSVVRAVYAYPELASVGWTEADAREAKIPARSVMVRVRPGLRDRLDHPEPHPGLLKVVVSEEGHLLGATAVHPKAADLITSLALAVRQRAKVEDLAALFPASPTSVEYAFDALRAAALRR